MMISRKRSLAVVSALGFFLFVFSCGAWAQDAAEGGAQDAEEAAPVEWKVFTPPAGDFSILMPAPVQIGNGNEEEDKKDKKDGIELYQSTDEANVYTCVVAPTESGTRELPDCVKAVQQGMSSEGEYTYETIGAAQGPGWKGEKFNAKSKDINMTVLVALEDSNSEVITMTCTSASADDVTKKYLTSLKVDTKKAKDKIDKYNSAQFEKWFHPKDFKEFFGSCAMGLGVSLWIVGSIVMLFLAFRTHILWGIGMIMFPIVGLVFVIRHFLRVWMPLSMCVVAVVFCVVGIWLGPQ